MARKGRKKAVAESPLKPKSPKKLTLTDRLKTFSNLEVERRVAAIQAIKAAEVESLLSRIRLIRFSFNKEQLATPAMQFFQENLPNISLVKNEKAKLLEMKWKDKEADGVDMQALGGIPLSVRSVKSNFWDITDLPDFVLNEQFENQIGRMSGVFQTPGETSSRSSFGNTPKTLRLPKKGEMLLSVRGSPLGVYKEDNLEAINEAGDGSRE